MHFAKPYDRKSWCRPGETFDPEKDMCHQEFKDECDVNKIMQKYQRDGVVTHVQEFEGNYGDFCDAPSFQEACNTVIAAEEMFMTLPSSVRKHFDNDPAEFLACAQDPDREDEMRDLGLLPRAEPVVSQITQDGAGDAPAVADNSDVASAAPKEKGETPNSEG